MGAKLSWKGRMSFTGIGRLGLEVPLGTSPESGGDDDGFSPMELVLVALGGCTAMDVASILKKKQQDVTGFEIRVDGERAVTHPKVYTHITVEYIITGHQIDPMAVDRAVELSVTKYCSVQAMLKKSVPIDHKITILEAA
jgi:putative redox protein